MHFFKTHTFYRCHLKQLERDHLIDKKFDIFGSSIYSVHNNYKKKKTLSLKPIASNTEENKSESNNDNTNEQNNTFESTK